MESLGAAIAKMLKLYNIEKPVQQNEALILWNDIVGKTITRHTTPEKINV
jgi:hypothetical protein